MQREGVGAGLDRVAVPRLVATGVGYAEWCPAMENVLMRVGVMARDYKEALIGVDWPTLVAAVERWASEAEAASIAYAIGGGKATSSMTAGATASSVAEEKEARRGATESVARTKKAFTMLYDAMPGDLRRLVAHVAQGDARTLWTWLKARFQSTEQDNIGDLWDTFTSLSQTAEETFDEYKARVDAVYELLGHANDKPSAGLYAHRVLWKLSGRYTQAVLALKAGGTLKDATKIDWKDVTSFINNHERSERRLLGNDDTNGASADERAMTLGATTRMARRNNGSTTTETRHCYNCDEKGHLSRDCSKPRRPRRDDIDDGRDDGGPDVHDGDRGRDDADRDSSSRDTYGRTRNNGRSNDARANDRNDRRSTTGRAMAATTAATSRYWSIDEEEAFC